MVDQTEMNGTIIRILAAIEGEHRALTALMASLGLSHFNRARSGQWSPIDALNHITFWQERALEIARAQSAPEAPEVDPAAGPGRILGLVTDQANADLLARQADWALDQALAWHNSVNEALRRSLAGLPPKRLLGGPGLYGARTWYIRPAVVHSQLHRQELEASLLSSGERQRQG